MKILIIDNYDSFTHNLYQLVGEILLENNLVDSLVEVTRNNEISLAEIKTNQYDKIRWHRRNTYQS